MEVQQIGAVLPDYYMCIVSGILNSKGLIIDLSSFL
jgi:hypothetical protein